jgi:hypothetical protein
MQAQQELFSQTCAEVRGLASDATRALKIIVRSKTTPAPAKVRAAGLIIGLLLRIHSAETQEYRLQQIERRLDRKERSLPDGH